MARSLLFSLTLHLAILLGLVILWTTFPHRERLPKEPTMAVRTVKVAKPTERPEAQSGLPVPEPATATETQQSPPPSSQEPPLQAPLAPSVPPKPEPIGRDTKSHKPQLLLPEPDYPQRPQTERSMSDAGNSPIDIHGQSESRNRPAIPYYHPPVTLKGHTDKDWILVKFEVEKNGTFQVEIVEGMGNIHQDARALQRLKRWRWIPMMIDGETYASVELVRLFKQDGPPGEP